MWIYHLSIFSDFWKCLRKIYQHLQENIKVQCQILWNTSGKYDTAFAKSSRDMNNYITPRFIRSVQPLWDDNTGTTGEETVKMKIHQNHSCKHCRKCSPGKWWNMKKLRKVIIEGTSYSTLEYLVLEYQMVKTPKSLQVDPRSLCRSHCSAVRAHVLVAKWLRNWGTQRQTLQTDGLKGRGADADARGSEVEPWVVWSWEPGTLGMDEILEGKALLQSNCKHGKMSSNVHSSGYTVYLHMRIK